jgi:hypothetical protein
MQNAKLKMLLALTFETFKWLPYLRCDRLVPLHVANSAVLIVSREKMEMRE